MTCIPFRFPGGKGRRNSGWMCMPEPDRVFPDTTSDCPDRATHTPEPRGYVDWFEWSAKMMRTHRQLRCPGCGLLKVWVPRPKRARRS